MAKVTALKTESDFENKVIQANEPFNYKQKLEFNSSEQKGVSEKAIKDADTDLS